MEEDCYESIYEDQVEAVYSINEKEFLILAKNGEESILTYNFSSRWLDWIEIGEGGDYFPALFF